MPVPNWNQIVSDPEYQKLQPSERETALTKIYDAMVEPDAKTAGLTPEESTAARDKILQSADPDLFGWRRGLGYAQEFASGVGGAILQMPFGAANLAMKGLGIEKPGWYAEAEKGLTEQRTPLQKAGEFGANLATLAIPWLGEAKAVQGISMGAKALMGSRLAGTAVGGTAARLASEVPTMMTKVGLMELLNTEDGKQAYEAAKSMAWIDIGEPGGFGIPGPAAWGPLLSGATSLKMLPGRALVKDGGGARSWSWKGADRRSLTEMAHESLPAWITKGILNSPPSAYRLGRDPELAVVKEFGFFKEVAPVTGPVDAARRAGKAALNVLRGGEMPLTQVGWKRLFRERINLLTNQVDDALKIAEAEGFGSSVTDVADTFDEIEAYLGQSMYGRVRNDWVDFFKDLRKGFEDIGTWDDMATKARYKTLSVAQRQKIELGKNEAWYSEKGFIDDISKMRRKLYHSIDKSIDDTIGRARAALEQELKTGVPASAGGPQRTLPFGPARMARPKAELEDLIGRLQSVGELNSRIASLLDAEHAITRTIKASRSDKAWFWFTRLGKAGALGSAVASLNFLVPSPTWAVAGGVAGLAAFTPMGRSMMAKSYPMPYGLPVPGVPMMAAGIAKSPWTARAAAASMLQSGPGGQPAAPAAPAADPDPLKLRQ